MFHLFSAALSVVLVDHMLMFWFVGICSVLNAFYIHFKYTHAKHPVKHAKQEQNTKIVKIPNVPLAMWLYGVFRLKWKVTLS